MHEPGEKAWEQYAEPPCVSMDFTVDLLVAHVGKLKTRGKRRGCLTAMSDRCARRDSNPRPSAPEADALSTELRTRDRGCFD